jgi:hypothetical protein
VGGRRVVECLIVAVVVEYVIGKREEEFVIGRRGEECVISRLEEDCAEEEGGCRSLLLSESDMSMSSPE